MMRCISILCCFLWLITSCKFSGENVNRAADKDNVAATDSIHPEWIMQSNVYEVNIRQYTKEGTFRAMAQHFERLKDMGVQILWLMPVTPISKIDRKGTLGSYYAVADYTSINPEFGNMEDFKWFVKEAHRFGFKVVTDWVANHTGADHPWVTKHPEFYNLDSIGKPKYVFDWSDTRDLNFENRAMRDSMIEYMKFWIRETNIDGYRCDIAGEVPDDFWEECIPQLRKMKTIFMLAEGDKGSLHKAGFNASYPWDMFQTMKKVANGSTNAKAIDSVLYRQDTSFPAGAIRLYFTSNHDENSWNKSDFGTFPGASHAPFAVLTQTMRASLPLIYSGQEEPVLRAISFFEKDSMGFGKYARANFYNKLLFLRRRNPALSVDAGFEKIPTNNDNALYAYIRYKGDNKVMVLLNLSGQEQKVVIDHPKVNGDVKNLFTDASQRINGEITFPLEAWGYRVFEYTK